MELRLSEHLLVSARTPRLNASEMLGSCTYTLCTRTILPMENKLSQYELHS